MKVIKEVITRGVTAHPLKNKSRPEIYKRGEVQENDKDTMTQE
jgi:hypothetical protein